MSTIFFEVAKKLITKCLKDFIKKANAADQALLGGLRNSDLSSEQIDLIDKLKQSIKDLNDEKPDITNLANLKKLIIQIDSEVDKARSIYSFDRGKLNKLLTDINSGLDRFYNELNELPLTFTLINIPNDDDPFHIFCKHSAFYFGQNIFFPKNETTLDMFMTAVKRCPIKIRKNKEACLLKHLDNCKKTFDAYKEGPEYDEQRMKCVIAEIEAIQRENAQICNDSKITPSIPISLTFFSTARVSIGQIKPSRGTLEKYMQKALKEVLPLKLIEAANHKLQ